MSKYEVKLVNIGEEVDNRIRELEIEVKDIRKANDNLTRANESYRQENIDLRKENYGVEVAMLNKEIDDLKKENIRLQARLENDEHNVGHLDEKMKRLDYLEKVFASNRYVFTDIPNTPENLKMVKMMKKYVNKRRYNLRWRGQYLVEGENWKQYQYGQPLSKSKCIRVYIDSKGDDTTEGFKESEVQIILDALDTHIDKCQEFVSTWEVEGETDDEDVTWNKQDIKQSMQLLRYFTEMKIHLEESKLARAEVTNNVT